MTIKELIVGLSVIEIRGEVNRKVDSISFDSRAVEPGAVFVAVKGHTNDGHTFIDKAADRGAVCVIHQDDHVDIPGITMIRVENSAKALAELACAWYEHPSDELTVVGVTGTNGKTTIATLLYRLFTDLGYTCGLLSTVENRIGEQVEPSGFTTPDALAVQQALRRMADAGCTHVFMEVSSHALDQNRVTGIRWAGAIFTNLTHDHLDYHGDFATYIRTKKLFFDGLGTQAFALINADDKHADVMVQNTVAKVSNYSLTRLAAFKGRVIENRIDGLHVEFDGTPLHVRLVGRFNASNLLAIYGAAILLGEDREKVLKALSALTPAEGRFDLVTGSKLVYAVVDYAHTPDALLNVLSTLTQVRQQGARILCIVGCGGDRDRTKRPVMARIAATHADLTILTSDNPRTENPEDILDQMWAGVPVERKDGVMRITDRKEAIRAGVMMAQPGDILLVAGKGHEKYQEINGRRFPFDDKQVLAEALA